MTEFIGLNGKRTSLLGFYAQAHPHLSEYLPIRRTSLRGWRSQIRGGSNPPFRTMLKTKHLTQFQISRSGRRTFSAVGKSVGTLFESMFTYRHSPIDISENP